MFDATMRGKLLGAYNQALDLLSVPATWTQAKPPNATRNITVGFTVATLRDEAIINAFGVGTRIVTVKHADLPSFEKFDQIEVNGERYTLDEVQVLMVNGTPAFWQGYIRGQ